MSNLTQILGQEFTTAGMSKAGAAGVIGNWQQESSLNASANGGLLGQWQGPRLQALQSFAQQQGRPVTDPVIQARFAVSEMRTQYPGLWHTLTTTGNPQQAAIAVSQQYERPGVPMLGNRVRYAAQAFNALGGAASRIASQMAAHSTPGLSTPGVTATGPTSTTDTNQALTDSLLQSASSPIDTSGHVTVHNPLGAAANAIASGAYTTSTPAQTTLNAPKPALNAPTSAQGVDRINITPGKGDVNPLGAGWTIGRTDQGVDANAKPGTPIRALNDSRVVQIMPNWYAKQPLVLMQITSGPNTGKYWYVAEQISHNLRVGQLLTKGSVVATYAPSGTGIEIGWGSPTSNSRTLAGQEGNTGGPGHSNSPAGQNFRATELR